MPAKPPARWGSAMCFVKILQLTEMFKCHKKQPRLTAKHLLLLHHRTQPKMAGQWAVGDRLLDAFFFRTPLA